MEKTLFKPTLFMQSKKETKYKTLDGKDVMPIQPGTMKECRQFVDDYSNVSGTQVYGLSLIHI